MRVATLSPNFCYLFKPASRRRFKLLLPRPNFFYLLQWRGMKSMSLCQLLDCSSCTTDGQSTVWSRFDCTVPNKSFRNITSVARGRYNEAGYVSLPQGLILLLGCCFRAQFQPICMQCSKNSKGLECTKLFPMIRRASQRPVRCTRTREPRAYDLLNFTMLLQ